MSTTDVINNTGIAAETAVSEILLDASDLFGTIDATESNESESDEFVDVEPVEPVDSNSICPFTVLVDSREQAPYRFLNIDPFTVIPLRTNVTMATGDYSIAGFESRVTIERKSISDFLGSITSGRERFEREFERMAEMVRSGGFAAVVIEGELSEVLREAASKSRIKVDSILGTVDAWSIRYGVHFRFCMGRRFAEIQTLKILYQFWRQEQHRLKELNTKGKVVAAC